MKTFLWIIIALLFLNSSAYSQASGQEKKTVIQRDYDAKRIQEEWYQREIVEAGYLGTGLTIWFKEQKKVDTAFLTSNQITQTNGLVLYIPKEREVKMGNGNHFTKLYLVNLLSDTVRIPRRDAAVDNLSEYVKLKNKWYKIRSNEKSTCGNSYYNAALGPAELYSLEVESIHQEGAGEEIPYKIVFDFNGKKIESNEIEILLYPNQIKRLTAQIKSRYVFLKGE